MAQVPMDWSETPEWNEPTIPDDDGDWVYFHGQPYHRPTVLATLTIVGVLVLGITGLCGVIALRRRRRARHLSLPTVEKEPSPHSNRRCGFRHASAVRSVRSRFQAWSERRARRRARHEAIKKFIRDAVTNFSAFITDTTTLNTTTSNNDPIQDRQQHQNVPSQPENNGECHNEKQSQAPSPYSPRPSSPSGSELSTTMDQELAQFRTAIEVVDSLVAAEEGRTRTRQTHGPPSVPWHVSHSAYPGFVNTPYHDDESDTDSLPPYDDGGSSSVADGFSHYTPNSSQQGKPTTDQEREHHFK